MDNVIIFGASKAGEEAYGFLKNEYNIIGFADNDERKWGTKFCECEVYPPSKCVEAQDCKVIIASMYVAEIGEQLRKMGVKQVYIVMYKLYNSGTVTKKVDFELKMYTGEMLEGVVYDKSGVNELLKFKRKAGKGRKNVLFFARSFPPVGGSGVQRPVKYVKYMQNYGWKPTVIAVGNSPYNYHMDYSQLSDIPQNVQCIRIDEDLFHKASLTMEEKQHLFDIHCGVLQNEELMLKYLLESIENNKMIFVPDVYIMWVIKVLDNIEKYVDMSEFDLVYTTMAPYSSAFFGYYIKKRYGIPWVADFRDPWTFNDYCWHNHLGKEEGVERQYKKLLEMEFCRMADCVVSIGPMTTDEICENAHIEKDKCVPITNGYDEQDFEDYAHIETDKFVVTYNGVIGDVRTPYTFIQAVNELIHKGKVDKCDVKIVFNGRIPDEVKLQMDDRDVHGIIIYNGYLSHKDSLRECMKTNALLHLGALEEGGRYIYCGKMFEYLRMRAPIIALSVNGSVIEQVLGETGCGKNYEYDDIEGIKGYFLELYSDWKNGKPFEYIGDMQKIQEYSRPRLTKKLVDVFERCTRR